MFKTNNSQDIELTVKEAVREVADRMPKLSDNLGCLGIDSLDKIDIATILETRLDIKISDSDMMNVKTVQGFVNIAQHAIRERDKND